MQDYEQIEALEKRIAALEQARQNVTVLPEEMVRAVMEQINRRAQESGNPVLLV